MASRCLPQLYASFLSMGKLGLQLPTKQSYLGICTLSFRAPSSTWASSTLKDMPAGLHTASPQNSMWGKGWGQGLPCQFKDCTMGQGSTRQLKSPRAPARQKCHLMLRVAHAQHSHSIWQHRGGAALVQELQKPPETWKEQRTEETKLLLSTYFTFSTASINSDKEHLTST